MNKAIGSVRRPQVEPMENRLLLSVATVEQPGGLSGTAAAATPQATAQAVWINPAGGYWDDPSNWQSGTLPGPSDDVVINQPGNPTITFRSGTATVNSITCSDPISLTGGTLTVNGTLEAAAGLALNGGNLSGAHVSADTQLTATLTNAFSTLDGIELDGSLALAGSGSISTFVRVVDGMVLNGTVTIGGGTGTGMLAFGNATSVPGSLTGTGTVILNGSPSDALVNYSSAAGLGALTIGSGILVHGNGSIYNVLTTGETIVNQGRIEAEAGEFLQIGNGESSTSTTRLVNQGLVDVEAGATMEIEGAYKTSDLGTLNINGGTLNLWGTLDNTGATLQLDQTSGTVKLWGKILNGTVDVPDSFTFYAWFGTLDGVTVDGNLSVYQLRVYDGLTLNGVMSIGKPDGSVAGHVWFGDNTKSGGNLMGSGTVFFNGNAGNSLSNEVQIVGNSTLNTTMVVGPGITVHGINGELVSNQPYDSIVNQGVVLCDAPGGVITVGLPYYGNVTNAGGTFGATNGGTLDVNGAFTTATLGNLQQSAGGIINLAGSLDNTGATLNLDATTGSLTLNGTIKGGTLNESGGALLIPLTATFDGVTINGDLNASLSNAVVTILDGLTLNGTLDAGSGSGSTYATVLFGQSTASPFSLLGTATIVFGGSTLNTIKNNTSLTGTAGTLTFGPSVTIRGKNGSVVNTYSSSSLIIQGAVQADTAGGTLVVDNQNGSLSNSGTMQASNGGSLTVANLADAAGLSVSGGGSLTLSGQWANTGSITVDNSTLNLGGAFTAAGLGTIDRTGGTVNLTGTLLNAGNTLTLDATTGSWNLMANGGINDGAVVLNGGATLNPNGGWLSDVTLASDLTVPDGHTLQIVNGMTLDGTLLLAGTGSSTSVYFLDAQTITAGTSNARISLQGSATAAYLQGRTGPMTLTLGAGLTVDGQGTVTKAGAQATTLTNQGTIEADVSGQPLSITPTTLTNGATGQLTADGGWLRVGGAWSNSAGGTLGITAGTLELTGTFSTAGIGAFSRAGGTVNLTGTLNNANSTFALNATTGSWNLAAGGTVSGGTITESDGAQLNIVSGRLTGVTLSGPLAVDEGHTLYVSSGITLSSGAVITLGNPMDNTIGTLLFDGVSQTLGGAGGVVFAGTGSSVIQLRNLVNNGPASATLTIGPGVLVHGQNGTITAAATSESVLNQGTINADANGAAITVSGTGPLTNAGTLEASAGTLAVNPALVESAGSTLYQSPSAQLQLGGNLTASNTGPGSFQPLGSVLLTGTGTTTSPQLLEVMSQDLGNTSAGFTNNFAYGSLSLSPGDHVRLTDLSNNSGTPGREALYVHSLVIPAGATLDLNGLNLYAMSSNIKGSVAGGTTSISSSGPNPATTTQSLTFTVAVSGGVPDGETVTLKDASDGNAVVATGTLSGGSATLTVPAGTLAVGQHNLIAVYAGDANFAASQSASYAQVVQAAPPTLTGAPLVNGDNPNGLFNAAGQTTPGQQRSMVEDVVYTFNQPVTITNANAAFTLAIAGPAGGTLPATLYAQAVAGSNGTQWAVSLTGKADGVLASIANGEYSITINPAYVLAAADGVTSMAAGTGRTDSFYRLYGDVFGTENVTALDYSRFKNSLTTYNPMFDNYNTGNITALDYALFKKDLSIDYSSDGFVTTI